MNNEELASQLDQWANTIEMAYPIVAKQMRKQADELDPPKSEPGTPVWWRNFSSDHWSFGILDGSGFSLIISDDGSEIDLTSVEWKPARVAGDDEVVVNRDDLSQAVHELRNAEPRCLLKERQKSYELQQRLYKIVEELGDE